MVYYVLILRKEEKGGVHLSFFLNNSKISYTIIFNTTII